MSSVKFVNGKGVVTENESPWHRERLSSHNIINSLCTALREGNLNSIQNLGDDALEKQYKILDLKNDQNQTILHLLCIAGGYSDERRVEIAEWIYTRSLQGDPVPQDFHLQNLNRPDLQKRTPLHYAAKFGRTKLLLWFIEKNLLQTIFDEDEDQLTPFHYLIKSPREELVPIVKTVWEAARNQSHELNRPPPLHLAAKTASVPMIELLIDVCGFIPDEFDVDGYTVLHAAIQHSDESQRETYSRILYLLNKTRPENYFTKEEKNSPLHVAARFGKWQILEFLFNVYTDTGTGELSVQSGECRISTQIHFKMQCKEIWKNHLLLPSLLNKNGQTCLHVIPNQNASQGSVECVKLILNHPDLMYERDREKFCMQRDKEGQTVLQIAAEYETFEVCQEILKNLRLDARAEWLRHEFLEPIYKKIPDALLPVFENCVQRTNGFSRKKELETVDFLAIVGEVANGQPTPFPETYLLQQVNSLNSNIRRKIFKNRLVHKFITEKFKRLRGFIIAGFAFHIVHICMFILLAYTVKDCPVDSNNSTNTSVLTDEMSPKRLFWEKCDSNDYLQFGSTISVVALTLAMLFAGKEVYQFSINPKKHFKKKSNSFQLLFSVLTIYWIFALVIFIDNSSVIPYKFLRILTATIVLLGVALSFHQLKKLNLSPSFIRLFLHVASKSAWLLAYYLLLVIAFMVVFKILSPHSDDYYGLRGIVKVLAMMLGEFEFDANFKIATDDSSYSSFLTISKLVAFVLFIFIGTIVGLNLLIGLTVEGIQTLKKDAEWEILSFQLDQLYMMEQFILLWEPFVPTKFFVWILDQINLVANSKNVRPNIGYYITQLEFPVNDNS